MVVEKPDCRNGRISRLDQDCAILD
jgi:hypothetical protein